MKQIIYTLGLLVASASTFGQLSKDEMKDVEREMKQQTPEQFVLVQEEWATAKKKYIELEADFDVVSAENAMLASEIKDYKAATQAAKLRIDELEAKRHGEATALQGKSPSPEAVSEAEADRLSTSKLEETPQKQASSGYGAYAKSKSIPGLVYKVQIGAFRNYDITKYFNRHDNFSGTVDADGTMRYTLGSFSDYWEADKFKAYLRTMGVNGAWVVAYKDGKRISMKAAREGTF